MEAHHQLLRRQFIPKHAPWYGRLWERLIGLTKQAISKTLGRTFSSLDQLQTVMIEIENMLKVAVKQLQAAASNCNDFFKTAISLSPYRF